MHVKKGDNVIVITGKDKGKTGKILRAFPAMQTVIVDGVNKEKKHQKPTRSNQKGQIIEKTMPIHVSNVLLVDPSSGKRTRIGKKLVGGKYVRVGKKSGSTLDK